MFHLTPLIMKLTGITGTGTGKLGSSVFAVNSGVQIVRQYQPVVSNPSTDAQVEQRAKLKLASQLARDLKLSIAIPRKGLVTSRNAFMSKNFPSIGWATDKATVNLQLIQLTESTTSFGSITSATLNLDRGSIDLAMQGFSPDYWEGIIVSVYRPNADNSLSFVAEFNEKAASGFSAGVFHVYDTNGVAQANDIIYVYAYAPTSADARAKYENMVVNEGVTLATLLTNRVITSADMQVSKTLYAKIVASV